MKLNEAIKSKFANDKHRASVNVLYSAYWLKDQLITVLKPYGITVEQHNVMRILRGSHPAEMRVKDIASRMVEKSSNVPRILDKLVVKKLAKRTISASDKRETLVMLTDSGIALIEKARNSIDEMTQRVLMISDKEARTLSDILDKMRGAE